MNRIIISAVILLFSPHLLYAQIDQSRVSSSSEDLISSLDKRQLEDYNNEAVRTVIALKNYISYISNLETSPNSKKEAMDFALSLFLNDDVIVYDTTSLRKNIDNENAIEINEFLSLVEEKVKSEVIVEWNNIYSQEDFDAKTQVKIVKADQVIKSADNYLKKELSTSNKLVKTHLVFKTKLIYGDIHELLQIKLGIISF